MIRVSKSGEEPMRVSNILSTMQRKSKATLVPSALKNEQGSITLDFIFALTVTISVAMVLFAVTLTFALVEVAQYVTYTTSRAYAGAHETPGMQSDLANSRYTEVMGLSAFKTFLGSSWVVLGKPQLGDFTSQYPETVSTNSVFVGAQISFNAILLHLNVPFLGSTAEDSGVGKATLNSYLMREVSTQECREGFNQQRYQNLKNVSTSGATYQSAPATSEVLITDNGC
jgi:hypothetical protein